MENIAIFLKKVDTFLETFEKKICGMGLFIITGLAISGVLLRTFFSFTFSWLEELSQYFMVWIVFLGSALSVKNNEHVSVNAVFSFLPEKYHNFYRAILSFICIVFYIFFIRYSIDLMLRVQQTGQTSPSVPWLQMYVLYVGVVLGNILILYEYIKFFVNLIKDIFAEKYKEKILIENMKDSKGGN
jgi:TRAP-type C4-dicarboxylate transport system permease small subunit